MKKLLYIITFFSIVLNAQSYLISNIPLPKTYIQNLDPYPCNEECLQNYLDNDMILSFLAHADRQLDNQEQDEIRMMNISILNLGSQVSNKLKIALLLPYKKIGRYAASTTNASFAYLLARNQSFELKTYNIESEEYEDIEKALYEIQENGFEYIIAPFTQEGAETFISLRPYENIYFPTINKKDLNTTLSNIYFGGIDYKAQSDLLLKEAVSPLVIFYDKSPTGKKLAAYEEKVFKNVNSLDANISEINLSIQEDDTILESDNNRTVVKFLIPRRTTNLEAQLFENEEIKRGSFIVNTPIVKSSMIISQLTMYDTNATNVLSTQINYDPLILSLTQYEDRQSMVIANSITQNNSVFIETNSLLGNDIVYDWINYTTTVGIDYFFNKITKQDRQYKIKVVDNQMQYPIELLQPSKTRFIKHFSAVE
ncbi:hypothetical protein FJR48_05325 [Sulfurimonas lithotrophica]|uniref:Periplasmic protein n=1 Tax=Sulfurimonas lithotrophica TaxID=2590022 RepID=A0A5P8P0D9_9BACT|nr:hypothetical protein [Sulfurimonas lithotrophica]QFR49176.1 hypothetical protein FJR48_05325 [Sulfurimonas lithotrophica]